MIVTDNKFLCTDLFHKDRSYEVLGCQLREFLRKGNPKKVMNTLVFQKSSFLLKGVEQEVCRVVRLKDVPGMRPESDHDCFAGNLRSNLCQASKNFLVPN